MTRTTCWRALVALVAATVLTAPVARGEEPPADRGNYQIGAGDQLDISVWKNAELSRQVTVRPDGMISLPLVNDVRAAGLTPMELRDLLARKLSEYVPAAVVSVIVTRVRSYSISVVGAVTKPGRFVLSSPTTVLEGIALAGGLTEFASRRSITVLRTEGKGATTRVPFNYNNALAGEASENLLLRPGDVIVVP
jgi:polysaccharide export outer membrane protein